MVETPLAQTLSVEGVAQRLGVSGWTVRTWIRQGRLPYAKIGRRLLVAEKDVAALLAANFRPATR